MPSFIYFSIFPFFLHSQGYQASSTSDKSSNALLIRAIQISLERCGHSIQCTRDCFRQNWPLKKVIYSHFTFMKPLLHCMDRRTCLLWGSERSRPPHSRHPLGWSAAACSALSCLPAAPQRPPQLDSRNRYSPRKCLESSCPTESDRQTDRQTRN